MKLKSFYKALREAAPNFYWRETKNGIRGYTKHDHLRKHPCCPITAVYQYRTGKRCPVNDVGEAQRFLKLETQIKDSWKHVGLVIVECADLIRRDYKSKREKQINKTLKKIVGIDD